jgi:ATP-binding cassette subfamily C (CFTR/MRP) protein 1
MHTKSTNDLIALVDEVSDLRDDEVEKKPHTIDVILDDVAISNEAKDLTRQSGDIEVYKYYFKSIGFQKMAIFIFFCILFAFSGCFSGMFTCKYTKGR